MIDDKTLEQKVAWLDGYKAATKTASSFKVRVDHDIDDTMNIGSRMVASLLERQVIQFEEELERERKKEA